SPRPTCCSKDKLSRRRIPEFRIREYRYSASSCALRAVLVKLDHGMVCVDPQQKWFQEYLRKQKKPKTPST
ncbi:CCL26 protein, partial [Malurus elegans]|nr:CCL26 protein [Malurus elegans]